MYYINIVGIVEEDAKMTYQTINQISEKLKQLIDDYWKLELSEEQLKNELSQIFSDTTNRGLVMRGPSFKAGFERKLGKKRIEEIKKLLIKIDKELYKGLIE